MSTNLLDNKYLALSRPNAIRDFFGIFAKLFGFKITQLKTVADYGLPFDVIAVGNKTIEFIPSDFMPPDSEHFIITGIRVFQGANATLAATAWTPGVSAGDAQNGSFLINNNGTIEMKNIQFRDFSTGTNNADGGYLELAKPIIWLGQTQMTITANFPVTLSTANLNLSIELVGIKAI